MDKLGEIGQYLMEQGKIEFAEHIAKMMLEESSSDEDWSPQKDNTPKGVRQISGWGEPDDYDSEQDYVDSEEDVDLSEDEGHAVSEDLEVKVDKDGFLSLA